MIDYQNIPRVFITYTASILGDTNYGLTGSEIIRYCSSYAIDYVVTIPHTSYPFDSLNKRTVLEQNLIEFSPSQQYRIIKDLCELEKFSDNKSVKDLKIRLISRYQYLSEVEELSVINDIQIEETKHWLVEFSDSYRLYIDALEKYKNNLYKRNVLDDLRLSLEILLRNLLVNNKSLENQISILSNQLKSNGGSKELTNMFTVLVDYFCKYQNTYVKHDDSVIEEEVEFIFEITSSFMKHLIKLLG